MSCPKSHFVLAWNQAGTRSRLAAPSFRDRIPPKPTVFAGSLSSIRRQHRRKPEFAPFLETTPMALARATVKGYEDDRMVLLFSMMDGSREVRCAVSS